MAITDADRAALGTLAMQAIDTILAKYGEDATLTAACLVYEVQTTKKEHHHIELSPALGNYHAAGMLHGMAAYMWSD